MQKLCCVRTRQHPLPVWSHKFVLSSTTHISTNSHPFLVGIVSHGDRTEIAKVLGRKRNADGNFEGQKHSNPILDSLIFVVEFPDGEQKDIGYNILAEHLHFQMDEGNVYKLFRGIIDHRKKVGAMDKANQYRQVGNKQVKKKTLAGWDIEVEWINGTSSWFPLKEVKILTPLNWLSMPCIIISISNLLLIGG